VPDCVDALTAAARERGYTLSVSLDGAPVTSVVDAADAWAADTGADVVLVGRGARLHVIAPGLGHSAARRIVRAAEATDDPVCAVSDALAARVRRPAWQRPVLASLVALCFTIAAIAARRAQNAK